MGYALVQSLKATSTATPGAAVTAAFGSNVTAGNRLFMFTDASSPTGGADIATPTKTAGTATISVFTKLVAANLAANSLWVDLWTATVTVGGSCTLGATANAGAGAELGWTAQEYSGLDSSAGSGCLDVSAFGTGQSSNGTNPTTGTTGATATANQLALCMVGDWGATPTGATWTLSVAGGFAKVAAASNDADVNAAIAVANKTSASAATESATWTNGAVTDTDIAWVAVIKLGAAVATSPQAAVTAPAFKVGPGPGFQPTVSYDSTPPAAAAAFVGPPPVIIDQSVTRAGFW